MQVSNNIFKHYIVGNLTKKQLQVKKKKKNSKYRIQRTVERVVQLSIPSTCTAAGTSEEGINSWSSKNKIKWSVLLISQRESLAFQFLYSNYIL